MLGVKEGREACISVRVGGFLLLGTPGLGWKRSWGPGVHSFSNHIGHQGFGDSPRVTQLVGG